MHDGELLERAFGGLRAMHRTLREACPGVELIERDGLSAQITQAIPQRSLWNSVVYDDPLVLEQAVPELARRYEEAGIAAWTVWVRPGDEASVRLLERHGHVLDASPMAMGARIGEVLDRPGPGDVPFWIRRSDIEPVGPLNDQAYGLPGDMSRGLQRSPEGLHVYVAGSAGPPEACACAEDQGDNCDITFVATVPEARGRGMAGALIRRLLEEGRERGCTTTTLVATKLGYPVYARMGYRDLGRIEMWERRQSVSERWLVPLPREAQPPYRVFVNGVPQREGIDYTIEGRKLVFTRRLQKEGRLGLGRWTAMFFGLFGTYRQNDSVDVQYTFRGHDRLATALDIIPPEGQERAGRG